MSVIELVELLKQHDIRLWLESGQLRFSAPQQGMSAELRDKIRQQKQQIIAFLAQSQAPIYTPIKTAPADQHQPLSFSQQRIWFSQQLQPELALFHLTFAFELTGTLATDKLEYAINTLLKQHTILRTAYYQNSTGIWQKVLPFQAISLVSQTLKLADTDTLSSFVQKHPMRLDLGQGEVFTHTLYQLSEQRHILLFTAHHIALDAWSVNLLAQQLIALYQGQNPVFSDLQYRDFAAWQQQYVVQPHIAYWKQQLSDIPHFSLSSHDQNQPTSQQGACVTFNLSKQQSDALQQLAQTQNVTLFMLLMAIFSCVLYRYSQQPLFSIGTVVSGRQQPELENMVGCFINLIVIRCEHKGDTFAEHLAQLKQTIIDAFAHQDSAFEKIVREIQPQQFQHSPLFQVLFNLQTPTTLSPTLDNSLTIAPLALAKHSAQYPLSVNMQQWQQGISAEFSYQTALFSSALITRLAESFQQCVHAVLHNSHQLIHALPCVTAQDKERQLQQWNNTLVVRQELPTVHAYIEQQAVNTPNNIAVIFQQKTLTYAQLNQQANALAQVICAQQLTDFVAILLPRSEQLIIAVLAVLKAGLAYLPIDTETPEPRIQEILDDANIRLLISDQVTNYDVPQITLDSIIQQQTVFSAPPQHPWFNVIYTSGSTGKAKGVLLSHQAMINRLLWMQETFQLKPQQRVLHKTSISFDVSVWEIFWPLMQGASVVIAAPDKQKDAHYLVDLIQQQHIHYCHFVPSALPIFLAHAATQPMASLTHIISSGEVLTAALAKQCLTQLPHCKLSNLYGPTEAAIDVTFYTCNITDNNIPIGRPISNTQVYIVDKQLQLLPIGAVGEIVLSGRCLAQGYLHHHDTGHFIAHPFIPKQTAYRTGDLGYFDEQGNLYFVGRNDRQVKIRGFRVELAEIEYYLRQYPAIQDALALEQQQQLIAYFIATDTITIESLRHFLQNHLPSYMLPNYFIQVDAWPLTKNDKIARHLLPAIPQHIQRDNAFTPARDEIEQKIAAIWQDLLPITDISIYDNFFSLGGHSLLASMAIIRIQETFTVNLPLADILINPTIAHIANIVRQQSDYQQVFTDKPLQQGEHEIVL